MTDYEDLAFKPKMTWEDFIDFAQKNGGALYLGCVVYKNLEFLCTGEICLHEDVFDNNGNDISIDIAENRSYEQMKTIIENLYGE